MTPEDLQENIALAEVTSADEDPEVLGMLLEESDDDPTIPEIPLPTIDDTDRAIEGRILVYPDWRKDQTFVASGPLPHGGGPGRMFDSVGEAAIYILSIHGIIIERIKAAEKGGRWAFRVPLPKERA